MAAESTAGGVDGPEVCSGAGLRSLDLCARRLRNGRLSTVDHRPSRGFTLIELMIVVVLLGLVMAVAVRGIRSMTKSDMRTSAVKMAGAIRYLFDRASTTGRMHRLVIDLDTNKYWAEVSDDAYYMPRERETDQTREAEAEEQAKEDEEAKKKEEEAQAAGSSDTPTYDVTKYQPQEWKAKRARFSAFKEMAVKPSQIKGAKIQGVFTPRLATPLGRGRGYIYFFPLGMTEAAQVYLSDEEGKTFYSLVVHPLTGRVQIYNRYVDPPVEEQYDDEGNKIVR
jgi:prepilin-type N-terminal cleavage/methylation domain-containing protein